VSGHPKKTAVGFFKPNIFLLRPCPRRRPFPTGSRFALAKCHRMKRIVMLRHLTKSVFFLPLNASRLGTNEVFVAPKCLERLTSCQAASLSKLVLAFNQSCNRPLVSREIDPAIQSISTSLHKNPANPLKAKRHPGSPEAQMALLSHPRTHATCRHRKKSSDAQQNPTSMEGCRALHLIWLKNAVSHWHLQDASLHNRSRCPVAALTPLPWQNFCTSLLKSIQR
jgi:hypothetical protein